MSTATYAYRGASALTPDGLGLSTSGGPSANPRFFRGFMTTPHTVAQGLLAVAEVARARYFQPADRAASLDPVVTGCEDMLRFESFSGCCGVYARMDVLPSGLDGERPEHGTTNVDVNVPLQAALARVGGGDPLHLAVGPHDLTVSTMDGAVVERKVPLPGRWLRGFAQVHAMTSGMEPRAVVSGAEAAGFLQRLPRERSVLWAVPAGRSLRLTARPVPGAVCLAGAQRLAALRGLARHALTLTVYGPTARPGSPALASVWELATPTLRVSLTLSPEPYRGFSGEGAVLSALAADAVADAADQVGELLATVPTLDVDALAVATGLPAERVRAALALLGTAGRVGYDVAETTYFHRVMPYGTDAAEKLNPRLSGAKALLAAGAVTLGPDVAHVRGNEGVYQVRLEGGVPVGCTCVWWGRHRGTRGPCRHQLATRLHLDATVPR
ncbi:SWIM zinc finger family protein [Catellatospora tritici]|uniref:SWIM zinc finger family protein n=1 Tax=Catellatospora tritici TaxID=2851566 RepID=UPI001C2DA43F|nr:SWIM zinc finger family protein [Catellatospora tritici]MBV1855639.1 SWIM zinc finger family protein [Catellatospora tritici]